MKAMILAAGGATKLYPLTYTLPKPLVPVLNVPVIEHIVGLLQRHGFCDIVINLHYLHRLIEDHLGDGSKFGVRIRYSFEPELLGTAGGVRNVRDFFDSTFLVIGADDLTDVNLTRMLEFHQSRKPLATVGVAPVDTPAEVGVLELSDDQRVVAYTEKPGPDEMPGQWCNTGVYLFEPEIFDFIPSEGTYDFGKQLFPALVEQGRSFLGYPLQSFWMDIGTHVNYRQSHWELLEGRTGLHIPGEEIRPHIWVDEGASVSPQAYIRPPALIGRGAKVEAGVEITGPVVLGPNVVVRQGAKVKRSVVWDGSIIGAGTTLDDCLIGSGCLLQSGQNFAGVVLASGARMFEDERESSD